jgi:hypothetical protein
MANPERFPPIRKVSFKIKQTLGKLRCPGFFGLQHDALDLSDSLPTLIVALHGIVSTVSR